MIGGFYISPAVDASLMIHQIDSRDPIRTLCEVLVDEMEDQFGWPCIARSGDLPGSRAREIGKRVREGVYLSIGDRTCPICHEKLATFCTSKNTDGKNKFS